MNKNRILSFRYFEVITAEVREDCEDRKKNTLALQCLKIYVFLWKSKQETSKNIQSKNQF